MDVVMSYDGLKYSRHGHNRRFSSVIVSTTFSILFLIQFETCVVLHCGFGCRVSVDSIGSCTENKIVGGSPRYAAGRRGRRPVVRSKS